MRLAQALLPEPSVHPGRRGTHPPRGNAPTLLSDPLRVSGQAGWLQRGMWFPRLPESQVLWEPLRSGVHKPQEQPSGACKPERLLEPQQGKTPRPRAPGRWERSGHCQKSRVGAGRKREGAEKRLEGPAWRSEASNATPKNVGGEKA